MKSIVKIGLAALVAASFTPSAYAAQANGESKAAILAPLTVTKTATLDFGKIVAGASAATVAVAADGAFNCGTGLTCVGSHSAGGFSITGIVGESVTISTDGSASLSSGTNTMTTTLAASAPSLTLTDGTASFGIGGVLDVAANQAPGDYAGSFNVTVSYQ